MTINESIKESFNRNDPLIAVEAMKPYTKKLIKRLKISETDREDAYQDAVLKILVYIYSHNVSNFRVASFYWNIQDAVKEYCNQGSEEIDTDVGYTIEEEVEDNFLKYYIDYCVENNLYGNNQKVMLLLQEGYSLRQIAKIISRSTERVRQIKNKSHLILRQKEYNRRLKLKLKRNQLMSEEVRP